MRYQIGVSNATVTSGIGPALVYADSHDEAKEKFAALEGTTVEGLENVGLTWWNISERPDTLPDADDAIDLPDDPTT